MERNGNRITTNTQNRYDILKNARLNEVEQKAWGHISSVNRTKGILTPLIKFS